MLAIAWDRHTTMATGIAPETVSISRDLEEQCHMSNVSTGPNRP